MTEHNLGHRHEAWGDDPEERDASAVYEEFRDDATVQEEWHDRVPLAPLNVVWRFVQRNGRRVGVTIVGFAVLLAGVVLLVLPGPGWLLIFIGLGILSTEYVWAQKMLATAKRKAEEAKDAVFRKKNGKNDADVAESASSDDPAA
jgi:hypothetical protein